MQSKQGIRLWIVCVTGFRQSPHKPAGLDTLWRDLREFASQRVCVVTPKLYNDDMEGFARWMARGSAPGAKVIIVGYSWGVGRGAVELAKGCANFGLRVPLLVSCDGIFYSAFALLRWRALSRLLWKPAIKIPGTVWRVVWARQKEDRPCGHDLILEDPTHQTLEEPVWVGAGHAAIDDSDEFREMALKAIGAEVDQQDADATGEEEQRPAEVAI